MSHSRMNAALNSGANGDSSMHLPLRITDPVLLSYLGRFEGDERIEKAQEALKVGVLSMQQATLSLDTRVVRETYAGLAKDLTEQLCHYLGDRGLKGSISKLIDNQVGPHSKFAKALDPKNKDGVIPLIEKIITSKLDEVLSEFSLDEKDSAMSSMNSALVRGLVEIKEALGVHQGRKDEALRGHVKGLTFQQDVYECMAQLGKKLEDETELVANTVVRNGKSGDHLITLGESSGAPGLKIVVEVKNGPLSLKNAKAELERAKENRGATIGILVWSKGCEPKEVDDFRMLNDNFYCTVDKCDLDAGRPLIFLEAAYKVARMMAVLKIRKDAAGKFDVAKIQENVEAVVKDINSLAALAKKAGSMKKVAKEMEEALLDMHKGLGIRLKQTLVLLSIDEAA